MSDTLDSLWRQAVETGSGRWIPGMLARDDYAGPRSGYRWRGSDRLCPSHDYGRWPIDVADCPFCDGMPSRGEVPDWDDPATVGCLLALVRERWGDPRVSVQYRRGYWQAYDGGEDAVGPVCLTEAEALLRALVGGVMEVMDE